MDNGILPHVLFIQVPPILMVNVAPVVFPAISVMSNKYIQSVVINVQLVYGRLLSVAVTHVLLSLKYICTPVVYIVPVVAPENAGEVLSIPVIVTVVLQVFHARSEKVNVNDPLEVKVCPVALSPVSVSLHDRVTITS